MPLNPDHSTMPDPSRVYQDWLDVCSASLMAGDAEGFCDMIHLPFRMGTIGGESIIETRDVLREDTENVIEALRGYGVTDYIRLVKKARYIRDDVIEGWHQTHVLRDAVEVVPSYQNRMVMRNDDAIWRVMEAEHELSSERGPVTLLRSTPGAMADLWEDPQSDIRATHARAEPLYAAFVDALSEAVHIRDSDLWCRYFDDPHEVHFDDADHIVSRDDELQFFERVCAQMDALGGDRLVRRVKYAEFVSGDRMIGYHDTTIETGGRVLFGPIRSRMVVTLKDGRWLCSSVTNSLSNKQFLEDQFKPSKTLPTLRDIEKRMKKK